jgi:chorismate mutase
MLESNIHKGSQKISLEMKKGVSITDACIDIETTLQLLNILDETVVYYPKTLSEIRILIRSYDTAISNGTPLNKSVMINHTFEYDAEIAAACKDLPNEEVLLMNVSMRLALSEKVAELKFQADPFKYLLKSNDLLSLITDREVEKDNLHTFNNPLYLKIMELSKNLQVDFLEKYISQIKIGYLFGQGSFSHEAIQNFRGTHISYDYVGELQMNLGNGYVDYMLVPTYNSIIGDIDLVLGTKKGSIEHRIELNLYSNVKNGGFDTLYIEPHIQKEAAKYIQTLKYKRLEVVKSTIDGCKKLLQAQTHDITIASSKNESNFLYTLDRNILQHNITTFSLF